MTLPPRVVVLSRRSELDELLAHHGTLGAAGFYLAQRGRDLDQVIARHNAMEAALTTISAAVPADWRRGRVDRTDLPRFLFGPEDIVIAVGPDGLVANVAKYLDGQPVIGVDPAPGQNAGVLVRFAAGAVAKLLPAVVAGQANCETRAMASATLDDGQRLVGLNEVYVGHPSHQSARYLLSTSQGRRERQSSSGIVVGTGTGGTGWCASIIRERTGSHGLPALPAPEEAALCWFVREAWPSPVTGVTLTAGRLTAEARLEVVSEGERLVVFADGVENDHLAMAWGQRVTIGLAPTRLRLVVP